MAALNRISSARLAEIAADPNTRLTSDCHIVIADPAATPPKSSAKSLARTRSVSASRVDAPTEFETFNLSSRPESDHVIYLDFNGADLTGTAWDDGTAVSRTAAPYDIDGRPGQFNAVERRTIYDAWRVIAGDYAPFDVNVTTAPVPADALNRDDPSDPTYGSTVLFTNAHSSIYDDNCLCTGLSRLGAFGEPGLNISLVYTLEPSEQYRGYAEGQWFGAVGSHETGHQLGLSHDGDRDSEYKTGDGGWAPIMGSSLGAGVLDQFSRGDYDGATNHEDDLAIIAKSIPPLPDDYGDGSDPTSASMGSTHVGLVGVDGDVDAFSISSPDAVKITVTPTDPLTNLDVRLRVLDSSGHVVADANPEVDSVGGLDAHLIGVDAGYTTAAPGQFTILVSGAPVRSRGRTVAPDYGSLGNYGAEAHRQRAGSLHRSEELPDDPP